MLTHAPPALTNIGGMQDYKKRISMSKYLPVQKCQAP
jgi:hypothetical protein